ncbi:M28 family peptidase [Planctopirus hydrillae]|uniref:Aminopeptidase n=1 Tax=Planctopirus hydrillae TaxID=1841610 RepID=A0A1C3E9N9_9PLAN|nr:M28 family peptidase [Planctopirus hydrillae]ODA29987.1 aminopeptidase [Planctopirus hydrillae]
MKSLCVSGLNSAMVLSGLWALLAVVCSPVEGVASEATKLAESKVRIQQDVGVLASDEMEGRGVGTEGLNKAAEFIRQEFQKAGLDVTRVNGGAFQTFSLPTGTKLGEPNSLKLISPKGEELVLEKGRDFEVGAFGTSGKFAGEVAFIGYGLEDKEAKYDDYAGIDVAGKVVVCFRRTPGQGQKDGPFSPAKGGGRQGDLRSKIVAAMAHKAVAILFVNDPYTLADKERIREAAIKKAEGKVVTSAEQLADASLEDQSAKLTALKDAVTQFRRSRDAATSPVDELMPFGYAAANDGESLPAFHLRIDFLNQMLRSVGSANAVELAEEIDATMTPRSRVLTGWKAQGEATVIRQSADVHNVIGVLEGEGPLANETVVIGAHYDHVGRGGAGSLAPGSTDIHNGADDNASGTAVLIEVARLLASQPKKPARRVVFMAFTGEELGLLGSARYCKEPIFPLDETVAMLNMDMVGRLQENKLTVFGVKTAKQFEEWLREGNKTTGFELIEKPEGFGPSDHSSFYTKKIPVLHFFTGLHPDYHRPSDDTDKLDVDGMTRVATLVNEIAQVVINTPARPEYVEVKGSANVMRSGNRPYVGTIPDFGVQEPGYAISGTAPGSPADKAGLKPGDLVIDVGGNKVTNLDDFDLALRKFKAGDKVDFTVKRKTETLKLPLELAPPR